MDSDHQDTSGNEILPKSIPGILRRMTEELKCPICLNTLENPVSTHCNHTFCQNCILQAMTRHNACPLCKTHITTKRSLNSLDHLEQLVKAYHRLREAFEVENGTTLSQVPRHFNGQPQENLSLVYPYPEKARESNSPATPAPETLTYIQTRVLGNEFNTDQTSGPPRTQRDSLDCFDVDLETVSSSEAAQLAERMMSIITLYNQEQPSESQQTSCSTAEPELQLLQHSEERKVKIEETEDPGMEQPTLSPQSRRAFLTAKTEPEVPELPPLAAQAIASAESRVLICTTYMTEMKKKNVDKVSKALRGQVVEGYTTRPTHVVMDISPEETSQGSGRTVKFLMGILRASWVLHYQWIIDSMQAGYWVAEDEYQVGENEFGNNGPKRSRARQLAGERPLFGGCEVLLFGAFNKPSKDEWEMMIRAGGGTTVPKLFLSESRVLFTSQVGASAIDRHWILYNPKQDGVLHMKKLEAVMAAAEQAARPLSKTFRLVPCTDLLDFIAQCELNLPDEAVPGLR